MYNAKQSLAIRHQTSKTVQR